VATSSGPVEPVGPAVVISGHQDFYPALLEAPDSIHLLLEITTAFAVQ